MSTLKKALSLFRRAPQMVASPGGDEEDDTKISTIGLQPFEPTHTILYLTTETQVNNALRKIVSGRVGFDTENDGKAAACGEVPEDGLRKSLSQDKYGRRAGLRHEEGTRQSDWSLDELSEEQKRYAALDAIASLKLYDALVPRLEAKSIEVNADIPSAWYSFNSKHGEPTRRKTGADETEITWRTSDCTWYAGGKFQGYPEKDEQRSTFSD
ncbi:hypothetical protein B0H19DRAFT_1079594 [Mycena capillaripes]|nr:hypothetical protein B0H19DRAFT_1079594 [Mycena capillaripes]